MLFTEIPLVRLNTTGSWIKESFNQTNAVAKRHCFLLSRLSCTKSETI